MDKYYKKAKKKVKRKRAFWVQFTTWGIVCTFLFILNMVTSPSTHWWIFPTLGWGVAVAIHFVSAYGFFKESDWEDKEIKKEMEKLYLNDTTRADYGELDLDEIPNREQYAADDFAELRKKYDDTDLV